MRADEENLISAGASMLRAASNGDAGAVMAALAEGASVDQSGQGGHTALIVAAIFNHVDIASLLLAAGANVRLQDSLGLTAREWADRRGSLEVAKLLLDASREEVVEEERRATPTRLRVEADEGNPETEANPTLQQLAPRMTKGQPSTKAQPQSREVEDAPREAQQQQPASATEARRAKQDDTVRFLKFHKRIMADQARREAEQARSEAEQQRHASPIETDVATSLSEQEAVATWSPTESTVREVGEVSQASPIETNISLPLGAISVADEQQFRIPEPHRGEVDEVARFLSELEAVAIWSSTEPTRAIDEALQASPIETNYGPTQDLSAAAHDQQITQPDPLHDREDVATPVSEPEAVATWFPTGAMPLKLEQQLPAPPIEINTHPQDDPSLIHERQRIERERITAEPERPIGKQSAKLAPTIDHLGILEVPRQREVPAKFEEPTRAVLDFYRDEVDATVERLPAKLPPRTATLESTPAKSLNASPVKRCPNCNASYGNPRLTYCAYDATKLVNADDSLFSYAPANDRSWQTLWALVAIVTVLGATLGYLINNYRTRETVLTAPIAAKIEQPPEIPRKDLPLIDGALSGTEVNVPEPEYPARAKEQGVSGTVTVRVQVNEEGRVVSARSSSGDWRLRAAAVEAAKKATFSPEKLAAHGKVVSGTIAYNFAVQTESPAATESPIPTQTDSPTANGSSSGNGSPEGNVDGNNPVVGGPLVGAERNLPQPDYPEKAKSKGISGTITIMVRVNRAGKVISWRTLDGDAQFRSAALKAAKKATFSPEKLPGRGEVVGTITYNFKP